MCQVLSLIQLTVSVLLCHKDQCPTLPWHFNRSINLLLFINQMTTKPGRCACSLLFCSHHCKASSRPSRNVRRLSVLYGLHGGREPHICWWQHVATARCHHTGHGTLTNYAVTSLSCEIWTQFYHRRYIHEVSLWSQDQRFSIHSENGIKLVFKCHRVTDFMHL